MFFFAGEALLKRIAIKSNLAEIPPIDTLIANAKTGALYAIILLLKTVNALVLEGVGVFWAAH